MSRDSRSVVTRERRVADSAAGAVSVYGGCAMRANRLPDDGEQLSELRVSEDGLIEPVSSRVVDAEPDRWLLLSEWAALVESYELGD